MKTRFTAFALAACISLGAHTLLAQSYSTIPVGFIKTTIAAATNSTTPTLTPISIPFYGTPNGSAAYAGAISAATSNTLSIATSGTWVSSQFTSGSPYVVRIKSTASLPGTGHYFIITGNTDSVLTVDSRSLDLTKLVAASDTIEIDPANTLGSTFGTQLPTTENPVGTTGVIALQTGTSANQADNIILWGVPPNSPSNTPPTWLTFYFDTNANYWVLSGYANNFNNAILYPDEGFFVRRRATSSVGLVVSGAVPSTTEQVAIPGPYKSFVANRFPIDMTLKASDNTGLNLDTLPGWGKGTSPNGAGVDNVLFWGVPPGGSTATWLTFYYDTNAVSWILNGYGNSQNGYVIPAGSAVFIYRRTTASGSAGYVAQGLPYSLN